MCTFTGACLHLLSGKCVHMVVEIGRVCCMFVHFSVHTVPNHFGSDFLYDDQFSVSLCTISLSVDTSHCSQEMWATLRRENLAVGIL